MTSISTAVGLEKISRVSGYKIGKFFSQETENMPRIIAIFAEANTANQSGLTTDKKEITSAQEAGEEYGYGSPIHQIMRILRPVSGDGVGGIPTFVFPQVSDGAATASVIELTVTGTASGNATHKVVVAGRTSLDFSPYTYSVVKDDTPTQIAAKIKDAVNSVLGCPFSATSVLGVVTLTTKWKGATSASVKAFIDPGSSAVGVTYAITDTTAGAGAVDLSASLLQFGDTWFTDVINSYGESQLEVLEQFNGKPSATNPTGRFQGDLFKPFNAFFGSVLDDKDDLAAITNAAERIAEQTNVLCPAPKSNGCPWEAAANMVVVYSRIAQDTPQLDANNKSYPDMPVPLNGIIGDMSQYVNRDFLVKKGCSTVTIEDGVYVIQDLVTTYHPAGESPLIYSYVRDLTIDYNVAFGYKKLEETNVKDHVLVADSQIVDSGKSIKPVEWKAVIFEYLDALAVKALINNPAFSKASLLVQVSTVNPNRIETFFRYKRTGIARIESTDVEVGF